MLIRPVQSDELSHQIRILEDGFCLKVRHYVNDFGG
jgi:hypothetical protein